MRADRNKSIQNTSVIIGLGLGGPVLAIDYDNQLYIMVDKGNGEQVSIHLGTLSKNLIKEIPASFAESLKTLECFV